MAVLEITTAERVRQLIGDDVNIPRVEMLVRGTSAQVEQYVRRRLLFGAFSQTFDVHPNRRVFSVKASPIASITAISNVDNVIDFEDSRNVVTFDDYQVLFQDDFLICGRNYLTIEGTGGMAATTDEFIDKYPDIVMEAESWIIARYRRLQNPDVSSQSVQGTTTAYVSTRMPLALQDCLDQWRRHE